MVLTKRMVCLANSRKLHGRCIAGRVLEDGTDRGWLRPVSDRQHEEVSEYERQYEDGSDPLVGDVIDAPLLRHQPKGYQTENWLLSPAHYWAKVRVAGWGELLRLVEPNGSLWINNCSTYHGENDQIPTSQANTLNSSLRLIRVDALQLHVFAPGEAFGNSKRRVQGSFVHAGERYSLWVTDPRYEKPFLARPDGEYQVGESLLTVSIGEPYKGFCYKLIAAIIERPG